jgi:hypothetical protein
VTETLRLHRGRDQCGTPIFPFPLQLVSFSFNVVLYDVASESLNTFVDPFYMVVSCFQPVNLLNILPSLINTFRTREWLFEPVSFNMDDSKVNLDASANKEDTTTD